MPVELNELWPYFVSLARHVACRAQRMTGRQDGRAVRHSPSAAGFSRRAGWANQPNGRFRALNRGTPRAPAAHEQTLMRIHRILVPTDFGQASDAAMAQARQLAAGLGATLHLVHVVEDGQRPERLASLEAALGYETAVLTGPVATTIVEYAHSHAFDLIVMGTHGRSGVAHLLLGSVAEQVVRTAPCPVLTVRQQPVAAQARETLGVPAAVQV